MRIYRDIIKSAWQLLWRYPWLWPLGLLGAVAGSGGEYGSLVSSIDRMASQATLLESLRGAITNNRFASGWGSLMLQLDAHPLLVVLGTLLITAVALVIIWIVTVCQASLIAGAGAIDAGERTSFSQATSRGAKKFWPIFCLNLLAKFAIYLVLAMAFLPFLAAYLAGPVNNWNFDSLIIISFIIFVPCALFIGFILKYAAIGVVLENRSWWTALGQAGNLFMRNWLVSLEMAALLFLLNLLMNLGLYALIPTTAAVDLALLFNRFSLLNLVRVLPSIILMLVAAAWYTTFQYSAWVLLFRRLRAGAVVSKLLRATDDIPSYLERWFWPSPKALPRRKR